MKKVTYLLVVMFVFTLIAGCSNPPEDILNTGYDVTVTKIDELNQTVYVTDNEGRLEDEFAIDCSDLTGFGQMIYVNYKTKHLSNIKLKDLKIGDSLILSVYDSQLEQSSNGPIRVEQIQLGTQRS